MEGSLSNQTDERTAVFERVLRPHLDALYRLAYHFTGAPDMAEDLLQSLLIKLYTKADVLAALEEPAPWLSRALHNLFVDQHRARGRQPVDLQDGASEALLLDMSTVDDDPAFLAEQACLNEQIERALDSLIPEQRAIVVWHDIEGYTLEELSVSHGIPLGTLKSRLHRARARLRARLMEPSDAFKRVRA